MTSNEMMHFKMMELGFLEALRDFWNVMDLISCCFYFASFGIRFNQLASSQHQADAQVACFVNRSSCHVCTDADELELNCHPVAIRALLFNQRESWPEGSHVCRLKLYSRHVCSARDGAADAG